MSAPFAALFDLDGVLMDTEGEYTKFWDRVDELYPTHVRNFSLAIKGSTLDRIFNTYFPDNETQKQIYQMLLDMELHFNYREFPDAPAFVEMLKAHGIPCIVVTSSNRQKMEAVYSQLPEFRKRLPGLVCDEDVTRSKPDPQGYLIGAERLGMPIEKCIVFEDSLSGLEAGRRSGARVIALATSRPYEELTDKAHRVYRQLADISFSDLEKLFD